MNLQDFAIIINLKTLFGYNFFIIPVQQLFLISSAFKETSYQNND